MDKQHMKEAKWGAYKTKLVAELESLSREDWTVVYTGGSAKVVRGWAQAGGYGAWYGPGSLRNSFAFVPLGEKQSVSRAELRGVLHAVRSRRWEERMIVVLDSEYVFKGITQWSSKWQRHQWRVSGREVEHKELWMARSGSSQGTDSRYDGCRLIWGWRGMKRRARWQSRGDCSIRIMRTPSRNDAALSSSGRSWGSRRCLLGRGRPATVGILMAQGACLGRGVHPEQLRVWARWGGRTAMNTVRMSLIITGRGARGWSNLWWRLTAPCWNCAQFVLARDGAVLNNCYAAAPHDT